MEVIENAFHFVSFMQTAKKITFFENLYSIQLFSVECRTKRSCNKVEHQVCKF